jgi:hypothetical protein
VSRRLGWTASQDWACLIFMIREGNYTGEIKTAGLCSNNPAELSNGGWGGDFLWKDGKYTSWEA